MSFKAKLTGISGFKKSLNAYKRTKTQQIVDQTNTSAINVDRNAKKAAPVGTPESTGVPGYAGGRLRSSIHPIYAGQVDGSFPYRNDGGDSFDGGTGERMGPTEAAVATNVEYASFVENGTHKMAAQPFLFPAWETERPRYIKAMRRITQMKEKI